MNNAGRAGLALCLLGVVIQARAGDDSMDKTKAALAGLLPAEVQGWKAAGEDRFFDPQTIFDYLDGGGEVYRSYNFQLLLSRRYEKPDRPALIADVFDMGTPADAFGVFTHDLDGEPAGIGQGSLYKAGLLSFWKGRTFVALTAGEETEESRRAVLEIGRRAAEAIKEAGSEPSLLKLVPEAWALPQRVHYFHTHPILNYHYFVAADNVLDLNEKTEAVLAVAGVKGAKSYLLIVKYPDDGSTSAAFRHFAGAIIPGASGDGSKQMTDKTWTAGRRQGSHVIIVFKSVSRESALASLGDVERLLEIKRK
jgi:hypothetical protein